MASRLLDRLKRSLFKDGQGAVTEQEAGDTQEDEELDEHHWEDELAREEEGVTDRLGGMLCFDSGGVEDVGDGEGSGLESDPDFFGESMEDVPSSTDTSPASVSPLGPSPSTLLAQQLQDSCRNLHGSGGDSLSPARKWMVDSLLFEVTDASVVQDGSSKYVLYTIHVIQSGVSDKTPVIIARRYSDFQRLHATLRHNHGDQIKRVCFPRKKMRRNFTAETIAKRSRAFEQYLSHLCSLATVWETLCVRQFFLLTDLQTGQLLIRVGRYQEALGPLLNVKTLQLRLGWTSYCNSQAQTPPPASSHWFFTLVGLSCCFQEVDQLEEARDHCSLALHVLIPHETQSFTKERPHPLLLSLLRAVVRLSWQTGKEKRQWEELLQHLEEQWAGPDDQPTLKEFLIKHNLQESEGECKNKAHTCM